MGYIGNHPRRNTSDPTERTGGARRLMRVRAYRSEHRLDLPIGSAATLNLPLPPPSGSPPPAP